MAPFTLEWFKQILIKFKSRWLGCNEGWCLHLGNICFFRLIKMQGCGNFFGLWTRWEFGFCWCVATFSMMVMWGCYCFARFLQVFYKFFFEWTSLGGGGGACASFGGVVFEKYFLFVLCGVVFVNLFLLLFLVSCILQQKCVKTIEGLANDMVYHFF